MANATVLKATPYCDVLAEAWHGDKQSGVALQRIFVKEHQREEIRMIWYENGNMAQRPADLEGELFVPLFAQAVANGVFTELEKFGMVKALLR